MMESWGVRLTCLDCNGCYPLRKCDTGDYSDTRNNDMVYSTVQLLNTSITLCQSPCVPWTKKGVSKLTLLYLSAWS